MKILRLLIIMGLLVASMQSHTALAINPFEQSAQTELISKMTEKDLQPHIDNATGNIIINKGNDTFWINIKGLHAPLLYTVNAKGYLFNKDSEPLTVRDRRIIAAQAASAVNAKSPCKVVYENGEVNFFMPIYSSQAADVAKSLNAVFEALTNAKTQFSSVMGQKKSDYLKQMNGQAPEAAPEDVVQEAMPQGDGNALNNNTPKGNNRTDKNYVVIEQVNDLPHTDISCEITGFSIRVVDASGNEIIGYDNTLRKDQVRFIQESVKIVSKDAGMCAIGVKIYNPEGKLMLPFASAKYTTVNIIDVKKNKKGADYQLDKFGFDKPGNWGAGDYRIEFVINDETVYTGTFSIL